MACPNCDGLSAFWCPACSLPLPSKPAVCNLCHDATCPCGKVVMRTDAELIDALRACRWILSQQVAAKDAEIARLKSRLRDAMAPRWHESGDDVAFLFVGNRVFAHVRRLPKIGYGWARGDYYPQSETDYTVPKGGQKRVAMNEARAALEAQP